LWSISRKYTPVGTVVGFRWLRTGWERDDLGLVKDGTLPNAWKVKVDQGRIVGSGPSASRSDVAAGRPRLDRPRRPSLARAGPSRRAGGGIKWNSSPFEGIHEPRSGISAGASTSASVIDCSEVSGPSGPYGRATGKGE